MPQQFNFYNQTNWTNAYNSSFTATIDANNHRHGSVHSFPVNHRIIACGVLADVYKPQWWLGGTFDCHLPITTSLTSSFLPKMNAYSQRLKINEMNLIILPEYLLANPPIVGVINTPMWIGGGFIEVDEYIGAEDDLIFNKVENIEAIVTEIDSRVP